MHIYGEIEKKIGMGLFGKTEKGAVFEDLALVDVNINVINKDTVNVVSVGSIVGCGASGGTEINRCYCTGNIVVRESGIVGGLAGRQVSVNDSYNACTITAEATRMGGICGSREGSIAYKYHGCYNIGTLTNETNADKAYAIEGSNSVSTCYNCYGLSGTATPNSGCTELFPVQLKDKRTLVGFDFENTWEIDPYCDYPYPQLKSNRQIRITSVDVVEKPDKTEYEQGDTLDLSNGAVKISYEDETTATIPITKDMVSGYDMNRIGEQNVIVTYCGICTSYPIKVKEVPLTGISLNQAEVSLRRNKTLQLSVNYVPANASDKTIQWTSSAPSIANVNNKGLVTAKNKGTATITATSANGLKAQCEVKVLIPCARITISKDSANMKVGDSLKLTAQMLPLDTTDVLKWKTSNTAVAGVSNGKVTAYKEGTVTITAYVKGGVSAACKIKVKGSRSNNSGKNKKNPSTITSVKAKISSIKSAGKSIKLKLGNLGKADGFQIQYSLKKNFKSAKTIKKKSTNVMLSNLKKNKRYYVRARVYGKINRKTYYGKWSSIKSAKIKKLKNEKVVSIAFLS